MKILHLGPLWFPVSRDAPGGRETWLAGLLDALQRLGCKNTLLASGDSETKAELVTVVPRNLVAMMQAQVAWEQHYYEQHELMLALERAGEFDVIHSHLSPGAFSLSAVPGIGRFVLHTQHTPVWGDFQWFVKQRPDLWLSTVSEFQARRLRECGAKRCSVIPNGIDVASFTLQPRGGNGLVFVGRIEKAKGPDLAVKVALQLGRPLTLAGPIVDNEFFEAAIKPHLGDQIRYVGVVNHEQKNKLFGEAGCGLLPFRGAEGFGMVSIEAMACGTPVVALANGALPEVVEPGVTGYLTMDEAKLPELALEALKLDRARVRTRMAARFDMMVVARNYLKLYEQIVAASRA
jgi:glycosyltransferase involved in cell wall biosynthesis